ncbi:MAG: hypothetical protein K0Q74_1096, partial [Gammaproteobacteria bacterium]|nr:hypothetical protein [Gammaproteobacteria bacterium]
MYEDNKQKIIAELKKLKDGLGRWKFAERGKLDGLIEKISRANFYDVGNLASFYASSDEILKDMDSEVCEEVLKILDSCFKIHLGQKSLKECTDIAGLIKLPRFENIQPRLHQLVEERITEHRLIANLIKRFEKVGEAVFSKMSAIREGQSLFLQDMEEKKKLSAASKEALQALMKKLPESITSSKQKIDVEMTTMKSARKDEMVETEEHYLNDQGMPQPYKYKRLERVEDHETRAKAGEELAGLFEQEVALSDAQRAKVGALKDKIKSLVKEKHSTSVQPTPAEYWSPNDAYRTVHKTETVPDYEAQTKLWAEIAGIYQPLFDKKVAQATEEMRATPDYKAEEQRLLDSIKDSTLKPHEEQKEKKLLTEMDIIADMDKRVVGTLGTLSSMQQGSPTYNEVLIKKLDLECRSMEANLNIFNSLSPSPREEKAGGEFANILSSQPRSESVSSSSSMVKPVAN